MFDKKFVEPKVKGWRLLNIVLKAVDKVSGIKNIVHQICKASKNLPDEDGP